MGRGREFRGPRRRGFDDDAFTPHDMRDVRPARPFSSPARSEPAVEGPTVDAKVTWFNAEKGFGFAEMADGSGDVFLHIAVLQQAGHDSVLPGSKLRVNVGQGQKGRQITRVLEVDDSTATAEPPRRAPSRDRPRMQREPDMSNAVEMTGTVKWFNPDKGFGFIAGEDGGKDVFVHISVLERAQLSGLPEGEQVSMRVVDTPKGREAVSIKLAGH